MRKAAVTLALGLALLAGVVLFRTARLSSRQIAVDPIPEIAVDRERAAQSLAQSLRFETVSHDDQEQLRADQFLAFHDFLQQRFPAAASALMRETIGEYSLLYTWKGQEENLRPVLLLAHMDVVPVEPGSESAWMHPAFEGRIAEGHVWGRGAWDDKASLIGIFEAIELLLEEGFTPQRTLHLAFGHDEEVGGLAGAREIASLLRSRGIEPEFILDEGGTIAEEMIPGIDAPVALIGIAEKGYVSVELTVESPGGHSSMPPPQSAVGILSAAIQKLEANPMPARLEGATRQMYLYLAPEMPLLPRTVFANLWLFRGLAVGRLAANPNTNAQIRTTTAATMFDAGVKDNVLPRNARAVVNFRILPGDSVEGVLTTVAETVNDPRVRIQVLGGFSVEPSRVSGTQSTGFRTIEQTIREVFPGTIVAPYLVVGATDSRHYEPLGSDMFRFLPFAVRSEDLPRLHGVNERVSVEGFADAVRFYVQLIRNSLR